MPSTKPAEVPVAVHADGDSDPAAVLRRARELGRVTNLGFAGAVSAPDAWALFQAGAARLIDVRTAEERKFVGQVPGSEHLAWATGTGLTRNPRFLRELAAKAAKDEVILFLCRSGKRSAQAAAAATQAGFTGAFNVLEGFEGDKDERGQRGQLGGWRRHDLPWEQD